MKFLLMTTSIISDKNVSDLERMLSSLDGAIENRENISHILLLQGYAEEFSHLLTRFNKLATVYTSREVVSLSKARNLMLEKVRKDSLLHGIDVVAFPDDDCWYPEGLLEFIDKKFSENSKFGFVFCNYSSSPVVAGKDTILKIASISDVVKSASSNTIFVRAGLVESIGGFDERLGVGAPNNGGEDLDYSIKAYLESDKVGFINEDLIGHRDKDDSLKATYFQGSFAALKKYCYRHPGILIQCLRKVLVGALLIQQGKMSIGKFTISK